MKYTISIIQGIARYKKCFLVVCLFFFSNYSFGQFPKEKDLNFRFVQDSPIPLYHSYHGSVIDSFPNNKLPVSDQVRSLPGEGDFLVTIKKIKGDWVKLKKVQPMLYDRKSLVKNVWTKLEYIETDLQNNFDIFSQPKVRSKVILSILEGDFTTVEIKDFKRDWVQVEFIYKKKLIKGWISKYQLCPLTYTTCNYYYK